MNKKEEIFTIGDKCEKGIISSFSVFGNNLIITYDNGSTQLLKYAKKLKQPLFTTEDGVDIFEGDKTWMVSKVYESRAVAKYIIGNIAGCYLPHTNLYFSTKEAAEEYILMNKTCLSVKDILERFNGRWSEFNETALKELVKSKI